MARPKPENPACYACASNKTYVRKNWHNSESWYYNTDCNGLVLNVLCMKCYSRYIKNPEQNKRRQYSNGKRVLLKSNPRIGICCLCRAVAGIDCDFTTIRNGIEMCPSCKAELDQENKVLKSISGWHKGKKHSSEHCKAMSIALKGRKPTRLGVKNSDYQKEQMSKFRMTQNFPRYNTKPEIIISSLLTAAGIRFETQIPFVIGGMVRRHKVDFLVRPNIIIECDGDYWHGDPKQTLRDKNIDEELLSQGYNVLRLRDSEILTNSNLCMNKINMVLARIKN